MTSPPVVLHIGPHKTGSTYIQALLRRNEETLHRRIQTILVRDPLIRKLSLVARLCHTDRDDPEKGPEAEARLRALADTLFAKGADPGRPVLISDELISGRMVGWRGDFAVVPRAGRIVSILAEAAAPRALHVVAYTRDHDRWLVSAHNQLVKVNRCALSFARFSAKMPEGETLPGALTRLQNTCGQARVHIVDMAREAASTAGLGAAPLRLCGFSDAEIAALARPGLVNPSLNAGSLKFMRAVNASKLDRSTVEAISHLVRKSQDVFRTELEED